MRVYYKIIFPMHPQTIFTKIAESAAEVENKTVKLPRDLARVFQSVDNKSTVADLAKKSELDEKALYAALEKLIAGGYIKVFSALPEAAAPAAQEEKLDFTSPQAMAKLNSEAEARAKTEAEAKARALAAARAAFEAKARQEAEARAEVIAERKAAASAEVKMATDQRIKAAMEAKAHAEAETLAETQAREEAYKEGLKNFWKGFLTGLTCVSSVYQVSRYETTYSSTTEALRSDWMRIGNDFRTVISSQDVIAAPIRSPDWR